MSTDKTTKAKTKARATTAPTNRAKGRKGVAPRLGRKGLDKLREAVKDQAVRRDLDLQKRLDGLEERVGMAEQGVRAFGAAENARSRDERWSLGGRVRFLVSDLGRAVSRATSPRPWLPGETPLARPGLIHSILHDALTLALGDSVNPLARPKR